MKLYKQKGGVGHSIDWAWKRAVQECAKSWLIGELWQDNLGRGSAGESSRPPYPKDDYKHQIKWRFYDLAKIFRAYFLEREIIEHVIACACDRKNQRDFQVKRRLTSDLSIKKECIAQRVAYIHWTLVKYNEIRQLIALLLSWALYSTRDKVAHGSRLVIERLFTSEREK